MNRRPQVFHILWSFALTFLIARSLIYLADIRNTLPDFYFSLFGYHLHHFNIGILALIFAGYAAITNLNIPRRYLAILFGFGLGLIVDEFGLLISLRDDYWLRQTYDVVVILLALLINIEYFPDFWVKIIRRLLGQSEKKVDLEIKNYPKVTVVIPAFNEEKNIAATLDSLKAQDYPRGFQIIVVDNGSTDKTAEIAKKYGAEVVWEPHQGPAYARQAGFMKAAGDLIVSTDADSIVPPNWLSRFIQEFARCPDAVAISGMYTFYDGTPFLRFWTWLWNFPMFCLFDWHSAANLAVKRDAFQKVGGFDINIRLSEDSDLCQRLRHVGKVERLANFKVETSARRFNDLGFFGGLWDYSINYLKFKLSSKPVSFKPGSQVHRLGFLPKLAINLIVLVAVLGGLFGIKPVRAQVVKRGAFIGHHIHRPNIDIDMPNLNLHRAHTHNHVPQTR